MIPDNSIFAARREALCDILKKQNIQSANVLEAIKRVPRHLFMDDTLIAFAYENKDQIILYGDDIIDENENIVRERDKDYTVLYETNLINTMKIIEEVSGDTEKGDIVYITKATKKTNDALILIQLHTECEQGENQDDAVIKIDLDIDNKSLKNWMPIRSLTPGTHIIDLHCPIKDMELDKIYNFKLKARCTSGKITIDKNKIKVLVYGEGVGFVQGITIPEEETEEEGE